MYGIDYLMYGCIYATTKTSSEHMYVCMYKSIVSK